MTKREQVEAKKAKIDRVRRSREQIPSASPRELREYGDFLPRSKAIAVVRARTNRSRESLTVAKIQGRRVAGTVARTF